MYLLQSESQLNKMMTEKNFENKVKKFLKEEHCWFIKYWGGGEFTKAGVPDVLCCCNGTFLGIEIKAPNGRPSELQIHNLKKIDEAGGMGIMLYPNQFDVFKILISALNHNDTLMTPIYYEELKKRWSK